MATPRRGPQIFKWRNFEPRVILYLILCAVRWYLRFSLSYRDVQDLMTERGVEVDHSTIWRWVQRLAPELNQRLRPHLKRSAVIGRRCKHRPVHYLINIIEQDHRAI